jgi:hypothetical protein
MEQITPSRDSKTNFDAVELLRQEYDRHINRARNTIFVVAAIYLVIAVLMLTAPVGPRWMYVAIFIFVSAAYWALGFWTAKKPVQAILAALILFCSLTLIEIVFDRSSISRTIIFRIVIIGFLATGLSYAIKSWRLKETLGK